jgi:hypothetical protein
MENEFVLTAQRPKVKKISKNFYLISFVSGSVAVLALSIISGFVLSPAISPIFISQDISDIKSYLLPFMIDITISFVVLIMYGLLTTLVSMLVYKSWNAVQDGHQRTSAGKAVGFLFIPLFNFYWIFQAFAGYAKDYNAYLNRYDLNFKILNKDLILTFCVLFLVYNIAPFIIAILNRSFAAQTIVQISEYGIFTVVLGIGAFIISKVCDAINNLAESTL